MRFLIAFAAVLGYASAGLIAPVVYGAIPGNLQGAAIDARVAAKDYENLLVEKQSLVDENILRAQNKAMRDATDASRELREKSYWGSVVASQIYIAAEQSRAAALSGTAAAHAAQIAAPVVPAVAPFAYAGYRLPAAYGHGLQAW